MNFRGMAVIILLMAVAACAPRQAIKQEEAAEVKPAQEEIKPAEVQKKTPV